MSDHPDDRPGAGVERLVELVGSRICHDLANPIGAITNGVELMQMADPGGSGAELQLVADSVAHASARLRMMRIAFGAAAPGQMIACKEAAQILAGCYGGSRLEVTWQTGSDRQRGEVKLAFLLLQCLEAVLPRGGAVQLMQDGGRWRIAARAERVKDAPGLWALLAGAPLPEGLGPAEVQFALAPRAAAALGRRITVEPGAAGVTLGF